ncbi:MAG: ATP-binding protein [Deltaproteobacteria bacterium]|nr:ATP-binding protein [Deltaproteobacteria bacterium]
MVQKIIQIPHINDGPQDFATLFNIWSQVNGCHQNVRFDFSRCGFLRPNAVAFLGGLARLIECRNGRAEFDWDTLRNQAVKNNLRQNGFAGQFGYPSSGWDGNSIPYREDIKFQPDDVAEYLSENWIGKGWLHVCEGLKNAIVERILELYVNAFEHSKTPIGVFSCGQYFKQLNQLQLAMVDFGVGIPANVRGYMKRIRPDLSAEKLKAADCLKWAFQRMTTTRPGKSSGGVGLDLLKSFIRRNNGALMVYGNDGYAVITAKQETYHSFYSAFEGTICLISLTCDEAFYCLTH